MGRKALTLLLAMLVMLPCVAATAAPLSFEWAFVKRAADGSASPIDFKEKVTIASGDLFKIYVKPLKDAFIYLFLLDSSNELSLLYPESFDVFTASAYAGVATYIPAGTQWFALDGNAGTERFNLLVSSERLTTLETLTLAFEKTAADPKASAAAKATARQAVLDEIARVRREHSSLAAAAESPVTMAGSTRGITTDIAKKATRIDADGFYTRTFRLDH